MRDMNILPGPQLGDLIGRGPRSLRCQKLMCFFCPLKEVIRAALRALSSPSQTAVKEENLDREQWLQWPLVPAMLQLANGLCMEGRVSDSAHWLQRAADAIVSVVPFSNVHVCAVAQRLIVLAHSMNSSQGKLKGRIY